MIIRSITIKNFGPHEHVHADFGKHAPVVGVLGINGSGKSNVLAALRYGLTGQASDTLETYIRNYDPESKTNLTATVEVTFVKHGVEGVIRRKITKSSASRELIYGTREPITKAALVDTMMEELLGTDLKAVAVAGFIGQGDLDRLLFGDQSDREKLFMRLLGLEELPKRGELVQSKIRLLLGQLEDLEPLRIADEERVRSLQETVVQLSEDVARRQDPTAAIGTIQRLGEINERINSATQSYQSAAELEATLLRTAPAGDVATLSAQIQAATSALETVRQHLQTHEAYAEKLRTAYRLKASVPTTLPDAAALQQQYEADQTALIQGAQDLTRLNAELQQLRDRQAAHLRIQKAIEGAQSAYASRAEAERQVQAAEVACENARRETAEAQAEVPASSEKRALVLEAAARELETQPAPDNEKICPVCASATVPTSAQLLARAADIRSHAQAAYERLQRATQAEASLARVLENARRVFAQATSVADTLAAAQDAARAEDDGTPCPDATVIETLAADVTARTAAQARQQAALQASAVNVKSALKQAEDYQQLLGRTAQALADAGLPETITAAALVEQGTTAVENVENLRTQTAQAELAVKTLKTQLEVVESFQQRLKQARTVAQTHALTQATAKQALRELMLQEGMTVWRANYPEQTLADDQAYAAELVAVILPELQRRAEELQQRRGELKQAAELLAKAEEALKLTNLRIAGQAHKMQVVKELETLAGALKRGGAPMLCLRRQFDQLTGLANLALGLMDSNFSVHTDPETPASFRFVRLDQSAGVVFGQSKLSGGQRVRLTVAFLLAVQQLILPDLGLLVLDEPSLHLDAPSIEQLRDLIVSTATQFGAAERQMWVCDHSPLLRPAFNETINL